MTDAAPTTRPRILHVVLSLEPGGMENGVVNLANALGAGSSGDFEIGVCCLGTRGAFAGRLAAGVPVWSLDKPGGFAWRAAQQLRGVLGLWKPQLLHTHNLGPLIYGGLASRFGLTTPILHGEHSELAQEEVRGRRGIQRRMLYGICRGIHTVGESMTRSLEATGLTSRKILTIVNGVDTARFRPSGLERAATRRELGYQSDDVVAGAVGRFGPQKGQGELLRGFEAMAADHPKLHLLLVGGGGPEESRVRGLAERSRFRNRIQFTGFQDSVAPYYRAMDFLVVASRNEGLSNAVLEAMACGLPVLASRACGNQDAIRDGVEGWIADLSDPPTIAAALIRATVDEPSFGGRGPRARERVEEEFSMNRMMQRYAEVYWAMARPRGRMGAKVDTNPAVQVPRESRRTV